MMRDALDFVCCSIRNRRLGHNFSEWSDWRHAPTTEYRWRSCFDCERVGRKLK